jgi:peptidyl-prolyl cis-trans isomerase SurA
VRVLLAEMIIPVVDGDAAAARAEAERIRRTIKTEADFNEAARRFSAAPTAERGGTLDWIALSSLPAEVAPVIMGMPPGRVSEAVEVNGAVALFFLREMEQTRTDEAALIRGAVDSCDDLYGVALRLPPEALVRETVPLADVPSDLAGEIAQLDDGESTLVTRGGQPEFLMLCGRVPQLDVTPSRDVVRNQLLNRRLAGYANGYLEELRADALIREP